MAQPSEKKRDGAAAPGPGERVDGRRLEIHPGMLLLSHPDSDVMGPRVYTARSKRVLICFNEGAEVEVTMTRSEVPDDWVVLDPSLLGRQLHGNAVLSQVAAR